MLFDVYNHDHVVQSSRYITFGNEPARVLGFETKVARLLPSAPVSLATALVFVITAVVIHNRKKPNSQPKPNKKN